jgi:hypothetical protein
MKRIFKLSLLVGCLSTALSLQLRAVTIELAFGDARSIGLVVDGVGNPEVQGGYINTLINPTLVALGSVNLQVPTGTGEFYTRTNNYPSGLTSADLDGFYKQDNGNTTFNAGTGFDYIIGKYDAGNAGMYVWYIGDLVGDVTVVLPQKLSTDPINNPQGQSLSHTTAYSSGGGGTPPVVPDGGSTVALLGSALVILAGIARRGASILES